MSAQASDLDKFKVGDRVSVRENPGAKPLYATVSHQRGQAPHADMSEYGVQYDDGDYTERQREKGYAFHYALEPAMSPLGAAPRVPETVEEWSSAIRVHSEKEKREALRLMVHEALREQSGYYERTTKSPFGIAFEGAGFQNYHIKSLLDVIEKTDALRILKEMLSEVPA